jgi:hypothetical protein
MDPKIYLLNNTYPANIAGSSSVIDHIETPVTNKREYFYNRRSLEMTFKSPTDFYARFSKIKFYEVDMIPFFRYTTEENVDSSIKKPLQGTPPFINISDSSISINNNIYTLAFTQSI